MQRGDLITFDSMHNLYANGLVQFESCLVFQRLFELGVSYQDSRDYVNADFLTCRCLGSHAVLRKAVTSQRERALKKGQALSTTASEMLQIRPVLLHFLQNVISKIFDISAVLTSFEALSDMCLAAFEAKSGSPDKDKLMATSSEHLRLFKIAYPTVACKPKRHYSLH